MEGQLFEEYARRYKDTVYRVALNYYANRQDAEDTLQEVFLRLYLTDKAFAGEEHVRHWLIRVTLNTCKNTLRSRSRRRQVPLAELAAEIPFDQREQSELFLAVMALPEKYRTVLYLFYYEDYSVREIAAALGLRESAVTTRLARARAALKQQLTEVENNG